MRIIFLFCLCLIATSTYAGEWIADKTNGCKFWDQNPKPNESIRWSGKCEGGLADGQGVLQKYENKSHKLGGQIFIRDTLSCQD